MKVTCGYCGRMTEEGAFCEKCGAALASSEKIPILGKEEERKERAELPERGNGHRSAGAPWGEKPSLEVDRMCVQFEDLVGTLRFRLNPGAGGLENVRLVLEHAGTGRRGTWGPRHIRESREIRVQMDGQPAGCPTWTVRLDCEKGGKRQRWEGDVDLVVARPREAQRVADSLKVEITNHITLGDASDAHVNQRALDGLEKLSSSENPFDVLKEVVCGSGRSWARVDLYETSAPPERAVRDRVALEWGGWTLRVFAEAEVRFGRQRPSRGGTDFTMRPKAGGAAEPFGLISRLHCTFARRGSAMELRDGVRTDSGVQSASTYGTWWEGRRLGAGERVRLGAGTAGLASFAGTPAEGAVTLRVDAGEGWLLMRRTDGMKEAFLCLWGDFEMARLDKSAGALELCRKDGAFLWRCAGQSGWIEPGDSAETPEGRIDALGQEPRRR